jgi:hypothetical protein
VKVYSEALAPFDVATLPFPFPPDTLMTDDIVLETVEETVLLASAQNKLASSVNQVPIASSKLFEHISFCV